jgi:hypothetical protein
MDLNTTISSLDASEVTFVQDKTLLVLVKGAFSSSNNLGEEKSRRNFSQTFLLTTARGGGRVEHGQYHQQQQQQQQERQQSYEFVCTNELLQLSREHQIDKGVGTRDTGADLYDGAVKLRRRQNQLRRRLGNKKNGNRWRQQHRYPLRAQLEEEEE